MRFWKDKWKLSRTINVSWPSTGMSVPDIVKYKIRISYCKRKTMPWQKSKFIAQLIFVYLPHKYIPPQLGSVIKTKKIMSWEDRWINYRLKRKRWNLVRCPEFSEFVVWSVDYIIDHLIIDSVERLDEQCCSSKETTRGRPVQVLYMHNHTSYLI